MQENDQERGSVPPLPQLMVVRVAKVSVGDRWDPRGQFCQRSANPVSGEVRLRYFFRYNA